MALWGKSELIYNSGKVTINFSDKEIKRHSGTVDFVSAGIKTGDVFTVGAAGSLGSAVVSSIVGVHTVTIASTSDFVFTGGNTHTNQDYIVTQKPKYTLDDPKFNPPEVKVNGSTVNVNGVTVAEASEAISAGFGSFAQHAGWVGVTTYVDTHGTLRVKSETLVASSSIT